jgi:hypothetical protein
MWILAHVWPAVFGLGAGTLTPGMVDRSGQPQTAAEVDFEATQA